MECSTETEIVLPPIVVLLAITAGFQVWGVLGAIVAVPTVATVRVVVRFLWKRAVPESALSWRRSVERNPK
jgi:predicted PurR-regulated permease PerM